jgi:hypothetical protein
MVRKPRSTVLLATDVPRALSRSTCRRSLRFSLIKSSIIELRFWTSSAPPARARRLVVRAVLRAELVRVRRLLEPLPDVELCSAMASPY